MIVATPEKLHGKARVKGTRIPVFMVLDALEENWQPGMGDGVRKAYPDLTDEDIRACLFYAVHVLETPRNETGVT